MLTYLMLSRVAQLCPGAVLTKLDKLVEPLKLTVTTKVGKHLVQANMFQVNHFILLGF